MRQWAIGLVLVGLAALVGLGVWYDQTLLLQVYVLAATGVYGLAGYLDDLPRAGWYATAAMFIAGAAMGALAYHGDVRLLFAVMWLTLIIWIETKIRHWLSDVIGEVFNLLN